jgi:hypothetical protein
MQHPKRLALYCRGADVPASRDGSKVMSWAILGPLHLGKGHFTALTQAAFASIVSPARA